MKKSLQKVVSMACVGTLLLSSFLIGGSDKHVAHAASDKITVRYLDRIG